MTSDVSHLLHVRQAPVDLIWYYLKPKCLVHSFNHYCNAYSFCKHQTHQSHVLMLVTWCHLVGSRRYVQIVELDMELVKAFAISCIEHGNGF